MIGSVTMRIGDSAASPRYETPNEYGDTSTRTRRWRDRASRDARTPAPRATHRSGWTSCRGWRPVRSLEQRRDQRRPRRAADQQDGIEVAGALPGILERLRRRCRGSIDQRPNQALRIRRATISMSRCSGVPSSDDERLFADPDVRLEAQPLLRLLRGPPQARLSPPGVPAAGRCRAARGSGRRRASEQIVEIVAAEPVIAVAREDFDDLAFDVTIETSNVPPPRS